MVAQWLRCCAANRKVTGSIPALGDSRPVKGLLYLLQYKQGQLVILQFTEVLFEQRRVFLTHFQFAAHFCEFTVWNDCNEHNKACNTGSTTDSNITFMTASSPLPASSFPEIYFIRIIPFLHSTGVCRMRRFLAILRSFFHSSLLCTFTCHPSPPTILPSSLTSSSHLFLGLPLNLLVPKFIYNTLLGILFSSILCTCPNQRNLFNLIVSVIVGFFNTFIVISPVK